MVITGLHIILLSIEFDLIIDCFAMQINNNLRIEYGHDGDSDIQMISMEKSIQPQNSYNWSTLEPQLINYQP